MIALFNDGDRDPRAYTLWWVSGDKQASMFYGNFASEDEALRAIPAADEEIREMCNDDIEYDEYSFFHVQDPTEPEDDDEN